MSNIDKQAVQAVADLKVGYTLGHADVAILNELARIALASLEAEPVAYIIQDKTDRKEGHRGELSFRSVEQYYEEDINEHELTATPLYTAPPAPISVPDELADAVNGLLDAMDEYPESLVPINRDSAVVRQLRAAMLQGAEPVSNRDGLPDGWVACSERMPEDDDFVYIWPRPDFGVELHVAQYGKFDKRDAGWYAQVYEQNYGIEYYPVRVTHWMLLPAAPQQEVKP